MSGVVVAVHARADHALSKRPCDAITLVAGMGVVGDAHFGATVQHRSRVAADPSQPNLRQVHLLDTEVLDELAAAGFAVAPGAIGENVTVRGAALLGLPAGTTLRLGADATVALTGLRNPCRQLDGHQAGLMGALVAHDGTGALVRRAGVMAVVVRGGEVRTGDTVLVQLPPGDPVPLAPV